MERGEETAQRRSSSQRGERGGARDARCWCCRLDRRAGTDSKVASFAGAPLVSPSQWRCLGAAAAVLCSFQTPSQPCAHTDVHKQQQTRVEGQRPPALPSPRCQVGVQSIELACISLCATSARLPGLLRLGVWRTNREPNLQPPASRPALLTRTTVVHSTSKMMRLQSTVRWTIVSAIGLSCMLLLLLLLAVDARPHQRHHHRHPARQATPLPHVRPPPAQRKFNSTGRLAKRTPTLQKGDHCRRSDAG